MGTRSVIVVTGNNGRYGNSDHTTVRLYRHFDGYPTANLELIKDAITRAQGWMDRNSDYLKIYRRDDNSPGIDEMPPGTFAQFLIAESITWIGTAARMDNDWQEGDTDDTHRPAVYPVPLKPEHFGQQGDIEWLYLVNIPGREVTVWACSEGDPESTYKKRKNKPTDPRTYADEMVDEYQGAERMKITCHMDQIVDLGWVLNYPQPTAKKPRKRKEVSRG